MLETYNHKHKIIGFDTFYGFPSICEKAGIQKSRGDYIVTERHKNLLECLLIYNES